MLLRRSELSCELSLCGIIFTVLGRIVRRLMLMFFAVTLILLLGKLASQLILMHFFSVIVILFSHSLV
ncbi:hypothetical protein D3C86_1763730 [compost metagenome]